MPAHKHAALMAEYAEIAKTSETPWEEFEVLPPFGDWQEVDGPCPWHSVLQYRRKQWQNPHKELILQYAQDCINHKEPWLLWEYSTGSTWIECGQALFWSGLLQYRRKEPS